LLSTALVVATTAGCAGVKAGATISGTAGTGGGAPPPINGLTSITVTPPTSTVALTMGTSGLNSQTVNLMATGVVNGTSEDVTTMVQWLSNLPGAGVSGGGVVTVSSPGTYTITARSGMIMGTATIVATFNGDMFGDGFNTTNNNKPVLDGSPSGSSQLVYPTDHALFPSNLSPIYAQVQSSGGQIARLHFEGTGVSVNYYGNCDTTLPGGGCYVKMPLTLTQLFVGPSEMGDIAMTARVSNGGAPTESQTINVAWASLGLSGGLYYWSIIPNPPRVSSDPGIATPGSYILLDSKGTSGTGIFRYAFTTDGTDPVPDMIWTDDGGPHSTPSYQGAPQAIDKGVAGGHCIGCHSITNDGKFMALTLGGSSTYNGANWSLLDIANQNLEVVNPVGQPTSSSDPNSSPTSNPTDYWKRFRTEGFATETSWGPTPTDATMPYVMVNMYQSKLYQGTVTISGMMATGARTGPVIPSWPEYASDPFWSQDGTLFAFTSYNTLPAADATGNPGGLNGDLKPNAAIGIATASATGINDDAKFLINRGSGVSSYYPAISNDSKLVVFNTSTCGSNPDVNKSATDYGNGSCDGYDDMSAQLWIVPPTGGASTPLTYANGGSGTAYGNSWPRFSPDKGTFRGQELYWVAFSSRRPYGLQVNSGVAAAGTKPQLWIAGVIRGEIIVGDPSYSAVWLPAQNPMQSAPNGNHVPQWVKVAVIIN
jgi:hypothetical protein